MSLQQIPLDSSPNQSFAVSLNVNSATLALNLSIAYNQMAGYWQMDIADSQDVPLVTGIPMVTGNFPAANLLQQYAYLRIGSAFIINASDDSGDYPGASNLGSDYLLWWGDN